MNIRSIFSTSALLLSVGAFFSTAPAAATAYVSTFGPQGVREAAAPRSALKHYLLEDGVALSGYDPVAYFAEGGGKPRKGKADLRTNHEGVTYRFASEENRARFLALPARYEPAYGGWCAWAMTDGDQVEPDPKSFLIENGQLLVFYDGFLANTRKKWRKAGGAVAGPKADRSWTSISGEAPRRSVRAYNLDDGLGLAGYDPVAYRSGSATPGQPDLALVHEGVTYRFASEANREAFLAAAETYEGNYGGWCAWAMAQGKQVQVDPQAFVVEDDRLYLFYNKDKRDEWVADGSLRGKADGQWTSLVGAR